MWLYSYTIGATEKVVQANEIILLQYDQSSNITWTVVSGGGSGGSSGAGLGDNNVWTGINTFNGAATSINSATINLGDSSGDAINIIGTVSSLGIPMGGNDINDVSPFNNIGDIVSAMFESGQVNTIDVSNCDPDIVIEEL